MPLYTCEQIASSFLYSASRWDLYPFLGKDELIEEPVQRSGLPPLFHPPLVLEIDPQRYEVLSDFRKLQSVCEADGIEFITCRVLPKLTRVREILRYFFWEHIGGAEVPPLLAAHFLRVCETELPQPEREQLLQELGFDDRQGKIFRQQELASLPAKAQRSMLRGILNENIARELLRLSPEEQDSLLDLFEQLKPGGGKQKRILQLLRDLAGREGRRITDVVQSEPISTILRHPEMNPPQKSHTLLRTLQKLHTPSLVKAEEEFHKYRAELKLPENCTLHHSPAFEKDSLTLEIEFTNKKSFEQSWQQIRKGLSPKGK